MSQQVSPLSLGPARKMVRRAVDKAEQIKQCGAFVVVDPSGAIITASRMDRAGNLSFGASAAKAAVAANHRYNSAPIFDLYAGSPGFMIENVQRFSRTPVFPGPGAQIIVEDGDVIGAISTGLGVIPMVKFPGVDAENMIADGKPGNGEDICISYAVGKGYASQHGDDMPRWLEAYGEPPKGEGAGMAEAPAAARQQSLDAAILLSDAVLAEAERRNARVAVAVFDRYGDVVQLDRMDRAAPMAADIAMAVAATAVNFGGSSASAADYPNLDGLARVTPFRFLAVAGGLALLRDDLVEGAVGVGGADPQLCEAIACEALAHV